MPHLYRSGATKTTGRKLLVISPAEAALGTINLIAGPNLTHSADVIHAEFIPDVSSQGAPHIFLTSEWQSLPAHQPYKTR